MTQEGIPRVCLLQPCHPGKRSKRRLGPFLSVYINHRYYMLGYRLAASMVAMNLIVIIRPPSPERQAPSGVQGPPAYIYALLPPSSTNGGRYYCRYHDHNLPFSAASTTCARCLPLRQVLASRKGLRCST